MLKDFITGLIKKGLSKSEVLSQVADHADYKGLEVSDIAEAFASASKAVEAEKAIDAKAKSEADQKALDEKVNKIAEKQVEEILKNKKVDGLLSQPVVVSEVKDAWKKDTFDMFKAMYQKDAKKVAELSEKAKKVREAEGKAVRTDSDGAGGYWVRPEFDDEVDKEVYETSALLNFAKIRAGHDKVTINGIGTIDLAFRTNQATAFGDLTPTFTQKELFFREFGGIVAIAENMIMYNYYDVTGELSILFADSKIRLLEPLIIQGDADGTDPFDGIVNTTGITSVDAKNKGGSGKITSADLSAMYLGCSAQTRNAKSACFVMDTRELMVLLEEKAEDGHYLRAVEMVNGVAMHKPTGKVILTVDTLTRVDGSIPVVFGVMDRFRIYTDGGLQIAQSSERYFEYKQLGIRASQNYMQGVPTNSLASFVSLSGIKNALPV